MMKYRKKPVVIEAVRFINGRVDAKPSWIMKAFDERYLRVRANRELIVRTLEGNMVVADGDYIIRGVQGEIYPCKPDIFEQTYEEVTDDD